jgi:hypothetical protein
VLNSILKWWRHQIRIATLAGVEDAFQDLEGGSKDDNQEAAQRLLARIGRTEIQLPSPTSPLNASVDADSGLAALTSPSMPEAPGTPSEASGFEDALQDRFLSGAVQGASQAAPSSNGRHAEEDDDTESPVIRKRGPGRPKKDNKP